MMFKTRLSQLVCQNWAQTTKLKPSKTFFDKTFKFLSFMIKGDPNNGNETKSDISSWDIVKADVISFFSKNIKVFQWI